MSLDIGSNAVMTGDKIHNRIMVSVQLFAFR